MRGQWEHIKSGKLYAVLDIGTLAQSDTTWPDGDGDIFWLEEDPSVGLYLRSHAQALTYVPIREKIDYGDRVFYVGPTGRWARPVESFLARFRKVGEC